ncbi:hypothetical protein D3C72_1428920 [compost metagenome]
MDQNLLSFFQLGGFDQHLPGGQGHQRNGCGLDHAEILGLQRQRRFLDGDELGEGADAIVVGARIDLVARFEAANASADPLNRTGQVVAQDQGEVVGKNQFEFAALDLRVQGIDARRVDLD